jgi:hypothetical protein
MIRVRVRLLLLLLVVVRLGCCYVVFLFCTVFLIFFFSIFGLLDLILFLFCLFFILYFCCSLSSGSDFFLFFGNVSSCLFWMVVVVVGVGSGSPVSRSHRRQW